MSLRIHRIMPVVFRDRAGHQIILHEALIQQPCDGCDIPDHTRPCQFITAPASLRLCRADQIITESVFSLQIGIQLRSCRRNLRYNARAGELHQCGSALKNDPCRCNVLIQIKFFVFRPVQCIAAQPYDHDPVDNIRIFQNCRSHICDGADRKHIQRFFRSIVHCTGRQICRCRRFYRRLFIRQVACRAFVYTFFQLVLSHQRQNI